MHQIALERLRTSCGRRHRQANSMVVNASWRREVPRCAPGPANVEALVRECRRSTEDKAGFSGGQSVRERMGIVWAQKWPSRISEYGVGVV